MAWVDLEMHRARRRFKKLLANVEKSNRRALYVRIGRFLTRVFRSNILNEVTYDGKSFAGTLSPRTQEAIRQRKTSRKRGRARKGKKLKTVVGGAHIRRGGGHVLVDKGHMLKHVGTAAVSSLKLEVGMRSEREAKKALGHHENKPYKGPKRRFIGLSAKVYRHLERMVLRAMPAQ